MIALLQRQHVAQRAVPPIRQRARNVGVRLQSSEISVPVGVYSRGPKDMRAPWAGRAERAVPRRGERAVPRRVRRTRGARPSFMARLAQARAQRVELRVQLARQRPVRQKPGHDGLRGRQALRRPPAPPAAARRAWLPALLALALLALVAVPALRVLLPVQKPVLPDASGLPGVLYRTVVPEEAPLLAAGARPPSLTGLQTTSYRTRAGDSLSLIAQRHRLTLGTVVSWNDIRDARRLPVGTLLELPNGDGLRYRVRRGDTLEQIARASGLPLNDILDWNRLASSTITAGQVLFLPGARMSQADLARVTGSSFVYPVRGRLSSTFGSRRDPFTGVVRFHNGIDIVARQGTAVGAAMAGTVAAIGFNANYGRYLFLQHAGYQTMYAHLSRITVGTGQRVGQGQKIGELGNSGYSTGPHLHFSVYKGAQPVDPLALLK